MDIRIRLTRKPMTTALWVILTAAMALLLSVGAAMLYSSGSLTSILDGYHTSIAVRTDRTKREGDTQWSDGNYYTMVQYSDKSFTEEDEICFEGLDCVEEVYFHTLNAAYSPELIPAIDPAEALNPSNRYAGVVLVGEITELYSIVDLGELYDDQDYDMLMVYGVLRMEELLSDHRGYTRRNADSDEYLNFEIAVSRNYREALQVGRRYVLLGSYDPMAHGMIHQSYGVDIEPRHPWFNALCGYADHGSLDGHPVYVECETKDGPIYGAPYIRPIDGTLTAFLEDPANADFVQAIDRMDRQHQSLVVLGTDNVEALHSFATNEAYVTEGRAFSGEEYTSGARVCMLSETVAKASGIAVGDTITLEQYLCANTPENLNLNNSLRDRAPDGRQNNPLISEFSIHTEYAPVEEFTVVGLYRLRAEWADSSYAFTPNTILIPKAAQMDGAYGGYSEGYHIYSKTDIFGETTTNTDTPICNGTFGLYFSIKLKNGKVSEFADLMAADERFRGEFLTVDQGFGAVMETLAQVEASTVKLMGMCLAGWAMLMMLYLLLYQGGQRKNIGIMRSLGASPKVAGDYLWKSGLTVAAIGIAVGTAASLVVVQFTQSKLLQNAVAQLPGKYSIGGLTDEAVQLMAQESQLPVWLLLLLALAQMALFGLVLRSHAKHTSRKSPRNLLSK